jgi:hypothetical protein
VLLLKFIVREFKLFLEAFQMCLKLLFGSPEVILEEFSVINILLVVFLHVVLSLLMDLKIFIDDYDPLSLLVNSLVA